MQYLESDDVVPDSEVDRMHVRDNLKAVTVSDTHIHTHTHPCTHTCMYTHTHTHAHIPDPVQTPYRDAGGSPHPLEVQTTDKASKRSPEPATCHSAQEEGEREE